MYILGISAYYHDAAAALLKDDKILAAAQEERFSRRKHDPSFPGSAVKFCLRYGGLSVAELDAVVFYDKPLLKFERLLETYYAFAPKGLRSFVASMPVWIKEKLFLRKLIVDELLKIEAFNKNKIKLLFSQHHLSHAASAFFPSPFTEAAILTVDGVGEWSTASISIGKGNNIKMLRELRFPHSVGLYYSAFTYYLGFKVNSGEYKLMGLAPYGNPLSGKVSEYAQIIKNNLINVREDGSVWLNQEYFDYAVGLKMFKDKKVEKLFGFPPRGPEGEIEQPHCDLALAVQQVTEDIIIKMAETAKGLTGERYLCLSGGVALNCVANGRLKNKGLFDDIWIQPASGDAGGALGAAYTAYHVYFDQPRQTDSRSDKMQGALLGPEFSDLEIQQALRKLKAASRYYDNFQELCAKVAGYLAGANVIGWFQGRMEWGPRALGNRSILADARSSEMQKRMNLKIKFRESFRPFAPSVLSEDAQQYFEENIPSPYMLLISNVAAARRRELPHNYYELPVREKLYHLRSDIPAVTHLDYSARVQTVHKETNPDYWGLLNSFKEKTGCSVLVNTSFNVRGEPIVCNPEDAYRCFMKTDIDYLVMGKHILDKREQPASGIVNYEAGNYALD